MRNNKRTVMVSMSRGIDEKSVAINTLRLLTDVMVRKGLKTLNVLREERLNDLPWLVKTKGIYEVITIVKSNRFHPLRK